MGYVLDKPMVLRTSYIHEVRRMGQAKYWANGIREFSLNFKQGLPDHKFDPFVAVPGVVCHWPKNAWVDADDCAPPCKSGRCCKDPNDPAAKGACFGVDVCQQSAIVEGHHAATDFSPAILVLSLDTICKAAVREVVLRWSGDGKAQHLFEALHGMVFGHHVAITGLLVHTSQTTLI